MLIDNEHLAGTLTGTVDGKVTIPDLRETITLRTFGFDGQVNAKDSTLFDLSLASAFFDGKVSDGRADVRQLTVDGLMSRGPLLARWRSTMRRDPLPI